MYRLCIAWILIIVTCPAVYAQQDDEFERWQRENDQAFEAYVAQEDSAYKAYVAEIKAKWNSFEASTKKKWVDYSPDQNTRSRIEFEDGYVELESIQEAGDPDAPEKAEDGIKDQLNKLVSADNEAETNILEDQIAVKEDETETVDQKNLDEFFKEKVQTEITPVEKIQSKDGKTRIKYVVKVPLVENHIVRRAEKYMDMVVKYASQYHLNPKLVLAIIYVESAFNPMAKSHADAHGMMQLVPRFGARDAYAFVYKQDRILSPKELYNPEKNIELGCAYLHLLLNRHWTVEPAPDKRRDLAICSYNWGTSNVKRKVYDRFQGRWLAYDDLYQRLRDHTPRETSNYLVRVLSRRSYFDPFFP